MLPGLAIRRVDEDGNTTARPAPGGPPGLEGGVTFLLTCTISGRISEDYESRVSASFVRVSAQSLQAVEFETVFAFLATVRKTAFC